MNEMFHPLEMLASILGTNPRVYKDIDREYDKKKWEYYQTGKVNFPDSKLLNRYTLIQEDYIRKSLGILLYNLDRNQNEIPLKIIKRGYKHAYHYAITKPRPIVEEFYINYIKKNGGLENIREIDLHNESIVLTALCAILGKKIDTNSAVGEIVSNHIRRLHNDTYGSDPKFYLKNFEDLEESATIIRNHFEIPYKADFDIMLWLENEILKITDERVHKVYGEMATVDDLTYIRRKVFRTGWVKYLGFFSALVKTSGFDENTFFDDFILSKEEMDLYFRYLAVANVENDINEEDLNQSLIGMLYVKAILKEYKKAKDYILHHQQDDFFRELNQQAKVLEAKEQEFKLQEEELIKDKLELKEKVKRQDKTIEALMAENKRLKEENKAKHQNQKELIALRNYVYRKQKPETMEGLETDNPLTELSVVKGAVIGGHVNWHNKLKRHLTHFRFIGPDSLNLDFSFIRNLDVVYVNTSYANHSLFRKLMKEVESSNAKLVFLDATNEYITFKEMAEALTEV